MKSDQAFDFSIIPLTTKQVFRLESLLDSLDKVRRSEPIASNQKQTFTQTDPIDMMERSLFELLEKELDELKVKMLAYKREELNFHNQEEMHNSAVHSLKNEIAKRDDEMKRMQNDLLALKEELKTVKNERRSMHDQVETLKKELDTQTKKATIRQESEILLSSGNIQIDDLARKGCFSNICRFLPARDTISLSNSNKTIRKGINGDVLFSLIRETKGKASQGIEAKTLDSYFDFSNDESELVIKKYIGLDYNPSKRLHQMLLLNQNYIEKAVAKPLEKPFTEEAKKPNSSLFESTKSLFKKLKSGSADDNYGYIRTNIKATTLDMLKKIFEEPLEASVNFKDSIEIFRMLNDFLLTFDENERAGLQIAIFKLYSDLLVECREVYLEIAELNFVKQVLFERFKRYHCENIELKEENAELEKLNNVAKDVKEKINKDRQEMQLKFNNASLESRRLSTTNTVEN